MTPKRRMPSRPDRRMHEITDGMVYLALRGAKSVTMNAEQMKAFLHRVLNWRLDPEAAVLDRAKMR